MNAQPAAIGYNPLRILDLANNHVSPAKKAIYHFSKVDLLRLAESLLELPASALADTLRLDHLSATSGHVHGQADGTPAVRILGRSNWHPTLRAAIDEDRFQPAAKDEDQ